MMRLCRSVVFFLAVAHSSWGVAVAAETEAPAKVAPAPAGPALPEAAAEPGWLGVSLENAEAAEGQPVLARVKVVFRDSPAARSGFQRGDLVASVGGHPISAGIKEMVAHVKSHPKGSRVTFELVRNGERLILEADLGEVPTAGSLTKDQWVGQKLPASLALRELRTDQPLNLESFVGEVLVVDVWATWCGPCRASMPKLEALQKKYASRGLRVVGVSNEEREVVQRFVDNRGLAFLSQAYDPDQTMASELYVSSFPTYIIVDAEGVIREVFRGSGEAAAIASAVEPLLDSVPREKK